MAVRTHEQCYHFNVKVADAAICIEDGHRSMIILRGVTGSGKTVLARELQNRCESHNHRSTYLSSDDIEPSDMVKNVRNAVMSDVHLVIIDAENVERNDIRKFSELAISEKAELFIIEPETKWKYDAHECQKRSTRGEDIDSIQKKICEVRDRPLGWEHIGLLKGGVIGIVTNYRQSYVPLTPPMSLSRTGSPVNELPSLEMPLLTNSTPQLFSLAPKPKKKTMVTSSTQVTFECIARELADCENTAPCGYFMGDEVEVDASERSSIRMLDRKTETEDLAVSNVGEVVVGPARPLLSSGRENLLEFSLLCLIFPDVETVVLRHQLEISNFNEVFQLMTTLREETVNPAYLIDNSILWDELDSAESFTFYSTVCIEDEMEERRQERILLNFFMDESFMEEETQSDEQIAITLDKEWNGDNSNIFSEEEKLSFIASRFISTAKAKIKGAYDASGGDVELACTLLISEGEKQRKDPDKNTTWSQKVLSPKPADRVALKKTKREEQNRFLQKHENPTKLEDVQLEALRARQKIELSRKYSYNSTVNAQFRPTVAADRADRLKNSVSAEIREIDSRIREAHHNPWHLDLHYMSVEGAINLVKEAIEAVRYHMKSGVRALRKIKVVTGSGNNSRGGAKIKPEIEAFFRKSNITHEIVNAGCFLVKLT